MANNKKIILKGDVVYSKDKDTMITKKNAYIVCDGQKSKGVFEEIPEQYKDYILIDYTDKIIMPGLVDLHVHASQYGFRGVGMDLELMEWLETHTFPEESKYKDSSYAEAQYDVFSEELIHSATTHAIIFATVHKNPTEYLMDRLEKMGLQTMVGKVNMDTDSPDSLREDTKQSLKDTREWIEDTKGKYENVQPIITPRFIPTCSPELLQGLGELSREYNLRVQSHLSENPSEVELVMSRYKDRKNYADVYHKYGLLANSVMAHCVQSDDIELQMLKDNNVTVAHCAQSNMNLCSGVAKVKKMLNMGIKIGLGTDVAGGSNISVMRAAVDAILASKMRYTLIDKTYQPLNIENALYLATLGGGQFFGKVGSFEKGYDMNAIVIDDSDFYNFSNLNLKERVERAFYLSERTKLKAKFVNGAKIV